METPSRVPTTTTATISVGEGVMSVSRRESFLEQVCSHDTESEEVVCALVDNLTEAEMGMLESYSDRLMEAGVTEEDAYQLSFDSFIKGVESYHAYNKRLSFSTADAVTTTTSTTAAPLAAAAPKMHLRWNEEGERVRAEVPRRETIAYYGASLRSLFSVDDYTQAQGEKDAELVTFYADEMTKDGGIDSDVAYGVALDSFLSDPEVFRTQMRKLGAPLHLFMQGDNSQEVSPELEAAAATYDVLASTVNADEEGMSVTDNSEELDELRAALEDVIVIPAPAVTATPRRGGRRLVNTPATVKTTVTRAKKDTPAPKVPLAVIETPISAVKSVVNTVPEVPIVDAIKALASPLLPVVPPAPLTEEAAVDNNQSADLDELRAALYEAVPTVPLTAAIATPRRSGRKLVNTPATVKTTTRGRKSTVVKMAPLPVIVAVEEPVSALKPVAEVVSTVASSATVEALEEVVVNKETVSTEAAPAAVEEVEPAVTVESETVHITEGVLASEVLPTLAPVEEPVAILASEPVVVAVIDDASEIAQISANLSVSVEGPVISEEQPAFVQNKRGRKKASVDEPTSAPNEQPTPKRGRSAAAKTTTTSEAPPLPSIKAPTPAKVKATKIPIVVVEEEAEAESEGEELVILCDG